MSIICIGRLGFVFERVPTCLHCDDKIAKRLALRPAVHEVGEGRLGSPARPQKHALECYCSGLGERISGPSAGGTWGVFSEGLEVSRGGLG